MSPVLEMKKCLIFHSLYILINLKLMTGLPIHEFIVNYFHKSILNEKLSYLI
jgi:hypothetical protein